MTMILKSWKKTKQGMKIDELSLFSAELLNQNKEAS